MTDSHSHQDYGRLSRLSAPSYSYIHWILKQAFDSINRKVMFAVLQHYGIPEPLVNAIGALYNNSKSAVMVDGNIFDPFEVSTGVLQGDVLAPFLFIILVDYLLKKATSNLDSGVVKHPRHSKRYPVKVLKTLTLRMMSLCWNPLFLGHRPTQLTSTAAAVKDLGLIVSVPKTEYMTVNCHPHSTLQIHKHCDRLQIPRL